MWIASCLKSLPLCATSLNFFFFGKWSVVQFSAFFWQMREPGGLRHSDQSDVSIMAGLSLQKKMLQFRATKTRFFCHTWWTIKSSLLPHHTGFLRAIRLPTTRTIVADTLGVSPWTASGNDRNLSIGSNSNPARKSYGGATSARCRLTGLRYAAASPCSQFHWAYMIFAT